MRLFFAIPLPKRVQELIARLQENIPTDTGTYSFTKPEQAHITLKFLGDTNPTKICERVANIPMPEVTLTTSHTGYFPDESYITVYWLGFDHPSGVYELAGELDEALPSFERDHDFHPHATIARVQELWNKDKFKRVTHGEVEQLSFNPTSYELVRSKLTEEGSEHTTIETFS